MREGESRVREGETERGSGRVRVRERERVRKSESENVRVRMCERSNGEFIVGGIHLHGSMTLGREIGRERGERGRERLCIRGREREIETLFWRER